MVNTFLLDFDYQVSASKLDNARLGKQRVEAEQILTILLNLHMLSYILNLPAYPREDINKTKVERDGWIRYVLNCFKKMNCKAIHVSKRGNSIKLYNDKNLYPIKIASSERVEICDDIVYHYKNETLLNSGHFSQFVLDGDFFITPGFNYHPAVSMWLGFEESLKEYINAHIDEHIKRGFVNTMSKYEIIGNAKKPSWLTNEIIVNFKSTLIEREIERKENHWYIYKYDFVCAWILNEEKRNEFCKIVNKIAETNYLYQIHNHWHINPKLMTDLLTFGKFPGFIWP